MGPINNTSTYLNSIVTCRGMKLAVGNLTKKLKNKKDQFDAIAFRGISGALVAPALAQAMSKDIIAVRKNESHHGDGRVEGVTHPRYIIVDDFVESGATLRAIKRQIKRWSPESKLVGVALYNSFYDCEDNPLYATRGFRKVWFINTIIPVDPLTEGNSHEEV